MAAADEGRSSYEQALLGDSGHHQGYPEWAKRLGRAATGLTLLAVAFTAGRRSAPQETATAAAPVALPAALPAGVEPITLWEPMLVPAFTAEPVAKNTVRRFDAYLMQEAAFVDPQTKLLNVEQWLAPDFVYETVGFPASVTPAGWCLSGEESTFRRTFNESVFSQMLFFGTDTMATTTSYGNVFWKEDFLGVPAPKKWVYFRVTDFYSGRKTSPTTGQLYYNFMMIDFADLFRRVGRPVVPPAALPEGLVLPPSTNDGVPAPLSVVARLQDAEAANATAWGALLEDWAGSTTSASRWDKNLTFYGPGGIGTARGVEQYRAHVLAPFHAAFDQRTVSAKIFGCEGNYCGAFGEIRARHVAPWLGLQASGKRVALRFALHWRTVGGLVQEGWAIFDLPGLFKQTGHDFFAMAAANPPIQV